MSNKTRKHPLKESLSENNGPPAKRSRFGVEQFDEFIEDLNPLPPPPIRINLRTRGRRQRTTIRRDLDIGSSQPERDDEVEFIEPSYRIIRDGGGKRKKGLTSSQVSIQQATDENDITELTRRFKKARLRPAVFFTISSFVEQTVDDVQVTMGDGDEEDAAADNNNNSDDGGMTVSSTFTFILPGRQTRQNFTSETDEEDSSFPAGGDTNNNNF